MYTVFKTLIDFRDSLLTVKLIRGEFLFRYACFILKARVSIIPLATVFSCVGFVANKQFGKQGDIVEQKM